MIIPGNTVGFIRPDWNQTDPSRQDYIRGREDLRDALASAVSAADRAKTEAAAAYTCAASAASAAEAAASDASAARTLALGKADLLAISLTLAKEGWQDLTQTAAAPGVTSDKAKCHIIPCASDAESGEGYYRFGLCCASQQADAVTFTCRDVPEEDITVNLLVLLQGGSQ